MLEGRHVCQQDLLDAIELRGGLRNCARAVAGDQHMHRRRERFGGGQRLVGRVLEHLVVVLGNEEGGHDNTPASFLSLSTSSATDFTFTPDLRPAGSVVLSTSSRGEM